MTSISTFTDTTCNLMGTLASSIVFLQASYPNFPLQKKHKENNHLLNLVSTYLKPLISSNTPIILQISTAVLFVVFSRTFHGNRFTPRPKNDGCFSPVKGPIKHPAWTIVLKRRVFLFASPGDRLVELVRKIPRKSEVFGIFAYFSSYAQNRGIANDYARFAVG